MAGYNTFKMYTFMLRDQQSSRNIPFSEYYQRFTTLERHSTVDVFQVIADHYLHSFRNQFMTNTNGDRGISVVNPNLLISNSGEQIIHGFVQGGPSDDQYAIYERDQTPVGNVEPTQILSQDYYFLIYFPRDSNLGCVMLQHNSSIIRGISSAFFEQLSNFFYSYGLKFSCTLYTPEVIQQNYLRNSIVSEIDVIEAKRTSEFDTAQGNIRTVKVRHTINGIKIPFATCIGEYLNNGCLPASTAQILGVATDQLEGVEVSVKCKVGNETKKYSLRREQVRANLNIDNSFIDANKTRASVQKMYRCAKDYLSLFKEEVLR